jgi:hypothetical protein
MVFSYRWSALGADSFESAIKRYKRASANPEKIVQFVNGDTGETVKGPKYDTTRLKVNGKSISQLLPSSIKQQPPIEPTQYEPRDRTVPVKENKIMNNVNKFKKLVKEAIAEVRKENDPKEKLKESLRPLIKSVLKEISNITTPEPDKEEKEKVQKGYAKDGNQRNENTNHEMKEQLNKIVKELNSDWQAFWDDHNQLIVSANNLLYVRIVPKFENNFDIDAMVKLVDRVRVIGVTWEQVKDFVKANFKSLSSKENNKTIPDKLKQRSLDHYEDRDVIKKAAGPMDGAIKNRGEKNNGKDAKINSTKKDDKDYNEPQTKKDEDMPDQPMKSVTKPGEDPESKNKNIEKTDKVKPPKHKLDKKLRVPDKKTPKLSKKN